MVDKKDQKTIPLTGGMPAQQGTLPQAILPPAPPSRIAAEAQRQGRANQMGFDTQKTYYHGTNRPDIESFDPNAATRTGSKGATFLTEDAKFANQYANSKAPGQVLPVHVNVKNTWDYSKPKDVKEVLSKLPKAVGNWALDQGLHKGNWNVIEDPRIQNAIKSSGFDSFHVEEGGRKNLAVFNPKNIRSKFAHFDTEKAESSKLSEAEGGMVPHYDEGGAVEAPPMAPQEAAAPEAAQGTIPIFDISGQAAVLGDVPHADVHEAVASGKYSLPKGGTVPVFNQQGELGDIPSEEAHNAFNNGYRYATPDDIDKHEHSTPAQQALTAVEGLASGLVSAPIAHGLEIASGLTTGKDIEARAKANPWTSGISEGVGLVGPALASLGASTAARLGLAGAVEATEAINAASKFTQAGILEKIGATATKVLGPKGESLIAKIGARGFSDAVQMGVYQGGNEVAKLIDGNPDSVGSAMANVGLSAVIGGGVGSVFGAISPLWKATFGSKVGKVAADAAGEYKVLQNLGNVQEKFDAELAELHAGIKDSPSEMYDLKPELIKAHAPEMHTGIANQRTAFLEKGQKTYDRLPDGPIKNNLGKMIEDFAESTKVKKDPLTMQPVQNPTGEDVFNASERWKKELGEARKFNKISASTEEMAQRGTLGSLYHEVRTGLENPEVWGKLGDVQQKINKAYSENIGPLKDFQKTFTRKINGPQGETIEINPQATSTFLGQTDKPGGVLKKKMLENAVESRNNIDKAISDIHTSLGLDSPIPERGSAAINWAMNTVTPGARLTRYVMNTGINRLAGNAVGTAAGASLGSIFGAGREGAWIGQQALGPMFESVFHSITKPIIEASSVNGSAMKAGIDYALAVAKGEATMNKAAKGVFKGIGETTTGELLPSESQRAKLDTQLKNIQKDPTQLTKVGGDIGHLFPTHAATMAATAVASTQYLNSIRPKTDPSMPLDSKLPPDPVKQAQYNRALDIANNPLLVTKSISQGTLTPFDVEALHNVNPQAYNRLASHLQTEMMDHISKGETVPYTTRLQLSMFLGKPLDSTMTPEGIMGAQPKPQAPQPQTPTAPASKPKSSTTKLGNTAKAARTSTQSREERSDK